MGQRGTTGHEPNEGSTPALGKETARLEAFSDGVLAIAITLLVLDLRLPTRAPAAGDADVFAELLSLWPQYLAFATSFAFIGIMWINHHRLFTHIVRPDTVLMLLNLLLLFGISILPFPTAVLAEHLGHPGEQAAALVYGGLFVVIAIAFNLLWRYAAHGQRLLAPDADSAAVARITRQYSFGPLAYLIALLTAFVSVPLFLVAQLLLAAFFALPGAPTLVPADGGTE